MAGFAQEAAMNCTIRCAHCQCLVLPNPRVKTQRFCSNKACQRARKAQWQRAKLATDPDYRANQRDCQQRWQHHHPQYWREYRQQHAAYRERNRLLQQHRDHKSRVRPLAKMDVLGPITCKCTTCLCVGSLKNARRCALWCSPLGRKGRSHHAATRRHTSRLQWVLRLSSTQS